MAEKRDGPGLPLDATLAFRLKAWREYRGLSRPALAKEAGVDYATVIHLETWESSNPTLLTLVKLAEALGITVSELVGM